MPPTSFQAKPVYIHVNIYMIYIFKGPNIDPTRPIKLYRSTRTTNVWNATRKLLYNILGYDAGRITLRPENAGGNSTVILTRYYSLRTLIQNMSHRS